MFDRTMRTVWPRERVVDAAVVAVLAILFFASGRPGDWLGIVLGVLVVAPVWFRRIRPFATAVVLTVAYSTWALAGYTAHPLGALPAAVAAYSLGDSAHSLWVKVVGVVTLVAAFSVVAIGMLDLEPLEGVFFNLIFMGIWFVGTVVAGRRDYASRLEERTRELEAARRELADKAVAEERVRLARELHDVVSHSLGIITVQAGVGAHLAEKDAGRAAEALRVIETTGRATLEELRRMLGMMRDPDSESDRRPQMRLGDLEDLIAQMEERGMDVGLKIRGVPAPLPLMVEASVYRVVQESLTNALKHAQGSATTVTLDHQPHWLELEVTSLGFSPRGSGEGGLGLRGMAERVAMLDGEFSAGPVRDGWRVWARLPRSGS